MECARKKAIDDETLDAYNQKREAGTITKTEK
jgi:hypothetical protein